MKYKRSCSFEVGLYQSSGFKKHGFQNIPSLMIFTELAVGGDR